MLYEVGLQPCEQHESPKHPIAKDILIRMDKDHSDQAADDRTDKYAK